MLLKGCRMQFCLLFFNLKLCAADPRERVKDDDLEVVLSPQRRSFGGGCQVAPTAIPRRPISPLENKENESLRLGGTRRIGSGRIMASRVFEREVRVEKERERDRDRDRDREFKDKRFRVFEQRTYYLQMFSFKMF